MKKIAHSQIVARQKIRKTFSRIPFVVILNDIRSLYNVGSIFRTADGAGVEKIYLCGITGHPPNNQISKTALGAEDQVAWEYQKDVLDAIKKCKVQGYQIVLLEQTDRSVSYDKIRIKKPVCLIIGNEVDGVSEEIVALCERAVAIEMDGVKNSLNVAVAFGIVAYQFRKILRESFPK